jgi:hypothetical protein
MVKREKTFMEKKAAGIKSKVTFLRTSSTCGLVLATFWFMGVRCSASDLQTFETDHYKLILDHACNVVGLDWKTPALQVIQEPRLGESFRILLPEPGYEGNIFKGSDQKAVRIERDANGVTCYFDQLTNDRETLPVSVQYHIDPVTDHVEFSIDVHNPTDRPLAEVFFGLMGGQKGIGNRLDTRSLVPGSIYNSNAAPDLYSGFHGGSFGGGNLGIRYSADGFTYGSSDLSMPWMEIYNPKANLGLYYANQDPETRVSTLYVELRPYNRDAVVHDTWPQASDLPPDEPIGLTFGWLDFPYTKHSDFHGGPIILQVHHGDWHVGSHLYRAFYDKRFPGIFRKPDWLRNEMAWQDVIMSNSEDVIHYRFTDLPQLAADAKKYGVTTFEILGWNVGGIDRGYPQYTPDPRLGTVQEFKDALKQIRAMGVHPVLFANFDVADTATPVYRQGLYNFDVTGRWAPDLTLMGWGEGTISARLGFTRSYMTLVSPSHPEFRQYLVRQFNQLVRDGAEGFQFDKVGGGATLDFNPTVPVSPDRSLPEGIIRTFQDVLSEGRKINPDLAVASETTWDRVLPYVDVSYMRMNDIDMPSTALRYTFPEWTATIFAENPGDRNVMNNGMRYGFVWAMAPRHYNASMDDPLTRPLSEYVHELIRIRKEYSDLLFHGRFDDTEGASVTASGTVRYSVFEGMNNPGEKGVVVVNYQDDPAEATVNVPGANEARVLIPFQPDKTEQLPAKLQIPPRTCAVVVVNQLK